MLMCAGPSLVAHSCIVLLEYSGIAHDIVLINDGAWLAGNFQTKELFKGKESKDRGETTVLQNSTHPSQQKFFEFLGTHCHAIACTKITLDHIFPFHSPVGRPAVMLTQLEVLPIVLYRFGQKSSKMIRLHALSRDFLQAAYSTSRRTTLHTASSQKSMTPSPSSSLRLTTDCSTSSTCT